METITPKERIIKEASYLFARHGFDGTGLRELAARAEVNLAMINYFFGSKKGLLKEILNHFFEGYLAIAQKELVTTENLHTKLLRFISSAIQYFESHQDSLLITITELPHDDPEIIEHKATWGRQMASILKQQICEPLAKETGQIIPATCMGPMITSLMASRFIFTPLMDHVRGDTENPVDISSYTQVITSIFLQGIHTGNNSPTNQTKH